MRQKIVYFDCCYAHVFGTNFESADSFLFIFLVHELYAAGIFQVSAINSSLFLFSWILWSVWNVLIAFVILFYFASFRQ